MKHHQNKELFRVLLTSCDAHQTNWKGVKTRNNSVCMYKSFDIHVLE